MSDLGSYASLYNALEKLRDDNPSQATQTNARRALLTTSLRSRLSLFSKARISTGQPITFSSLL